MTIVLSAGVNRRYWGLRSEGPGLQVVGRGMERVESREESQVYLCIFLMLGEMVAQFREDV